jgi:hypothetical protein
MGHSRTNPSWWTNDHTSAWDRVREAMRRDWEQTKYDFNLGGKHLDQDVDETVKQAAGSEPIPPRNVPNPDDKYTNGKVSGWDDLEGPLGYGYGARLTYGQTYPTWNDDLERKLETDWRASPRGTSHPWEKVKSVVRRGYEYVAGKT